MCAGWNWKSYGSLHFNSVSTREIYVTVLENCLVIWLFTMKQKCIKEQNAVYPMMCQLEGRVRSHGGRPAGREDGPTEAHGRQLCWQDLSPRMAPWREASTERLLCGSSHAKPASWAFLIQVDTTVKHHNNTEQAMEYSLVGRNVMGRWW